MCSVTGSGAGVMSGTTTTAAAGGVEPGTVPGACPGSVPSECASAETVRCDAALTDVFAILGKRWNGVIIGALSNGPASFSQLSRGVTGISDSVLSERLSGLASAGIVTRVVDSGPPVSVPYALSEAGRALLPALDELRRWAEGHLPIVR